MATATTMCTITMIDSISTLLLVLASGLSACYNHKELP
jgi:hypothetical protein